MGTIVTVNGQTDFKIEVKNIDAQKALVIKKETPTSQIGEAMGEVYGKLFSYLEQNNIAPAGAPFAVYLEFDPQGKTVFEAGVPVSSDANVSGELIMKDYPGMKVACTKFVGSYDKMMPVYEAMDKYLKDSKLEAAGGPWEVYLTDPAVTEPDKNETLVYFPVNDQI
ncbi:MAG: GyrI-like domain-containing protein [Bacteroidales bacterium]|nr:GyrI-like domain-containing protein [Bacteroidales bacterium]